MNNNSKQPVAPKSNKISSGMQKFVQEVVARYNVMPILPFVDVEINVAPSGAPNDFDRIFHMKKYAVGSQQDFDIVRFKIKHNCKRCYGMGYTAIFESNDPQYNGRPLLSLCSCLREIKKEPRDVKRTKGRKGNIS